MRITKRKRQHMTKDMKYADGMEETGGKGGERKGLGGIRGGRNNEKEDERDDDGRAEEALEWRSSPSMAVWHRRDRADELHY